MPAILWKPDKILQTVSGIEPQLASWDKRTHPSQIRLKKYLDEVMKELHPVQFVNLPLFLHLDVDVRKAESLLKHHDLENYLTPLFGSQKLDSKQFSLVSARKYVGGGSRLQIGSATVVTNNSILSDWRHFNYTTHGSTQNNQWKENLRNALALEERQPLPPFAIEMQIAWKTSPKRTWVNLWKITGDCLGPILGEPNPLKPFAPNDDRIVKLAFHHTTDANMKYDIHIDIWWRTILPEEV